jgi:hypothetical protein
MAVTLDHSRLALLIKRSPDNTLVCMTARHFIEYVFGACRVLMLKFGVSALAAYAVVGSVSVRTLSTNSVLVELDPLLC